MNKAQTKRAVQTAIDSLYNERKEAVDAMREQSANPQVRLMIEKNLGYMLALEDVIDLLYKLRVL